MEFPLCHPHRYTSSSKPKGYFFVKKGPNTCGEGATQYHTVLKENLDPAEHEQGEKENFSSCQQV
jgi:hypothetical protein